MDNDFPADQLIAEATTLRCLDGVAAGVRIPVHQMGMQDAHVGLMHLRDQAVWRKADIGVNPVRAPSMEDTFEKRARGVRGAYSSEADPKK
jgi:hypothetical protein